jgi:KaiC domain protein
MVKRIKSGIPGFDEIIGGGIPERSVILLSGIAGTGKTTFAFQFLLEGLKSDENGIYVALEEHPSQVRKNIEDFGWNVREFEEKKKIAFVDAFTSAIGKVKEYEKFIVQDISDINEFTEVLKNAVKDISAKRVVVDSISTLFTIRTTTPRNIILQLKRTIYALGCTAIFVNQLNTAERGLGSSGIEHLADGIIKLDLSESNGELKRSILVWKMKGTAHSLKRHPFEITSKGIVVFSDKITNL